jgi:hypothetical protein
MAFFSFLLYTAPMQKEHLENYSQYSLPETLVEGGSIQINDWTHYANEHCVTIPVPKEKAKRRNNNNHRTRRNELSMPLYKKAFDTTIRAFKKNHANSRPVWAKLFSEKEFSKNKHDYKLLRGEESEGHKLNYLEKEDFKFDSGNITVLRYADYGGYCQRVVTIWDSSNENILVRQEDKISRNQWVVTSSKEVSKEEVEKLSSLVAHC